MKVLPSLYLLPVTLALGVTAAAQSADVSPVAPTGNYGFASQQSKTSGGAPKALLFDNGPYITQTGVGAGGADVSEIEPGLTLFGVGHQQALGYRVADDFDVPSGATWTLSELKWRCYQTNAPTTGTINEITTEYLDGMPSGGGTSFAGDTSTNRFVSQVWSGVYRVTSTSLTSSARAIIEVTADASFVPALGAGNYWVSVACGGTLSSGPWAPPTVPWDSSDNGEQFLTSWNPLTQGQGGAPIDFPFMLEGSSAGGGPNIRLNEIYASHSGTDDREMIELVGDGGTSLDNIMVLVVEGDSTSAGTLDRAWDLTGNVMPADGYFVLGDDGVVNQDFSIGVSNAIENGTDTFYLIEATDPAAVTALLGSNVVSSGTTTTIPTLGTILDLVGMADGGYPATDFIFDGATVIGPDGSFLPAGIFRGIDYPNDWCPDSFLDFDPFANANEMRTPGTQNVNCDSQINAYCTAQVNSDGCAPVIATVGTPSASAGSGFDVDATLLMKNSFALLIYSTAGTGSTPFGGGEICLAAGTVNRTSVQLTGGAGACGGSATLDFNAFIAGGGDPALVAGQDVFAQYWSRDEGDALGSNTSSAVGFNIGS